MKGNKILIIGGYGFLGKNILHWIDHNFSNFEISILSSIRSASSNNDKFKCVKEEFFGDFGDNLFLRNVFLNNEYDYIFHLLTSTIPANSNSSIIRDIETNLVNTIRLLEIISSTKATLVFFSSGGAIYGNGNSIVHSVGDNPNPISSYGIVKNTIEQYISVFHNLYGLKYLNLRISNPYGYFHKSKIQGVINVAINRALQNETIEIWGDGENIKDYIFAADIPPLIFSFLDRGLINRTLNLGSGQGSSINTILQELREVHPQLKVEYKASKNFDVKDFILEIKEMEGMRITSLKEGIINTYKWYKEAKL